MSQQYFFGCTARDTLQFHLFRCAICQLTNPFNIVYLVSPAHHFKGITLSGEKGGLEEEGRESNMKKGGRRTGREKGIFSISIVPLKPSTITV